MKHLNKGPYEIDISVYDRFNYLVTCHKVTEDNEIIFCGKLITNDINYAIDYFTKATDFYYLDEYRDGYAVCKRDGERHGTKGDSEFARFRKLYLKSVKNGKYTWTSDLLYAKHYTEQTAVKHLEALTNTERK